MRFAVFLALPVLAAGLLLPAFRPPPEAPFYLGGIQVNEPDHAVWVEALRSAGLDTVAVTVYARQGDWDSANLWHEPEEPWVVHEARAARDAGLQVVLVLRVALDHAFERNRYFWHGMIQPRTDAEVEEWFDRYERFAVEWGRIAERQGIGVLAIASELNSLTNTVPVDEVPGLEEYWSNAEKVERENARLLANAGEVGERRLWLRGRAEHDGLPDYLDTRAAAHAAWARQVAWLDAPDPVARINDRRRLLESRWQRLVDRVREVYSGTLTYAANFDQYESVSFWDRLDLLSVNAYFPLRRRYQPGLSAADLEAQLTARWRTLLRSLDAFRRARGLDGRRVLFSEIGYVARANSTIEPWASTGLSVVPSAAGPEVLVWEDQPADPRERALALRALYRAHLDAGGELLAGLLWWKLSTRLEHRAVEPFVAVLGAGDPLLAEMRPFGERLSADRWRRRLAERVHAALPG